ncbi:er lumen protein retaining receptor [Malassezia pachydermatis]|uniref:Er lumen protein retaining receptor n=1 Tax=Malassezia pachydermatis TaxID=77020 RepID=A0A0M8MTT5_9BASI|nr:er lumen protein retaining receptor [Malassezia pachydermatis]KOS14204.1 er lumen protein retaining receptor [Malassezia pachydermatis]
MNIFRLLGDLSHLASIFILIHKIVTSRSCRGISFKTQLMYTVVFLTRYLELFRPFSLYLILMKVFFIASSVYILYLMKVEFKTRHEADIDTIRLDLLMGIPAILALLFNYKFTFFEVLWSYSIFLEAVAILPQMFLLQRLGEAETITTHYIFALGAYRALYILNWIYRLIFEPKHHFDYITFIAGLVQTGLYGDFFYIYFTKVVHGQKFELPA